MQWIQQIIFGLGRALPRVVPTVLRDGPYTFIFFSSDKHEPIHIHVKRERKIAKFWLQPVRVANNEGFKQHELNRITHLLMQYEQILIEAWHEYFDA